MKEEPLLFADPRMGVLSGAESGAEKRKGVKKVDLVLAQPFPKVDKKIDLNNIYSTILYSNNALLFNV